MSNGHISPMERKCIIMTESTVKSYQNRIIQASKEQLLVITYELFIEEIMKALQALHEDKAEDFNRIMVKVHKLHRELTDNLDMSYPISRQLMSLYIYMNKKLIESSIKLEKEPLTEVKVLAEVLLEGFRKAATEESSESLVQNAQKVYAGLTYGKGTLNETVVNSIKDRGFKA